MRILTQYLLRAHFGPFLFALSVLTGLLLINTVARRFEELAGKGLSAGVIAEVFLLSIPHILALTLPMAVLVAVLYAFSHLTAENEVAALKANGVNIARLLVPLTGAATVLALLMVIFNDRILPETNHALKNLLVDIGRKSPTLELKEQMINEIQTGDLRTRYFLQAAEIEPSTNRLKDVVIYDLSEPGRGRTVYADSGRMAFNRERTDLFLTLYDGWINETEDRAPDDFQRLFFERQLVRLAGVGNQLERSNPSSYRSDREMSLTMLRDEIRKRDDEIAQIRDSARSQAHQAVELALAGRARWLNAPPMERQGVSVDGVLPDSTVKPPPAAIEDPALRRNLRQRLPARRDTTTAAATARPAPLAGRLVARVAAPDIQSQRTALELRTLENRTRLLEHRRNAFEVEYHKKYSIPFACIVFVLIGAPLAVRFPRGGVGMVIAVSLTIFMVYYMSLIGGENLADDGVISPFWAMWAPNVLFFAIGLWSVSRMGKEMATSRGGGWDDLWFTARRFALRPLRRLQRARA